MAACRYQVPDYWTIGEVYERLIEDVSGDREESLVERLIEVYTSGCVTWRVKSVPERVPDKFKIK